MDAQTPPQGTIEPDGTLVVPSYRLPISDFVSPEFRQEYIKSLAAVKEWPLPPAMAASKADWDKFDAMADRLIYGPTTDFQKKTYAVDVADTTLAGVHVGIVTPKGGVKPENRGRVLIHLHGGGMFMGRGLTSGLGEAIPMAALSGLQVITVDYRMSPYYSFPAASEDVEAVYRELLKQHKPGSIGIYGCSSGGILTAQSLVWLESKALPRPGAAGIFCAGLTPPGKTGGDSRIWTLNGLPWITEFETRAWKNLGRGGYMATAEPTDPRAYPVISDAQLAKFPSTLMLTGTRATELSWAVVNHTKFLNLDVDSQIYIVEGGVHGAPLGPLSNTPEGNDTRKFIAQWFLRKLAP